MIQMPRCGTLSGLFFPLRPDASDLLASQEPLQRCLEPRIAFAAILAEELVRFRVAVVVGHVARCEACLLGLRWNCGDLRVDISAGFHQHFEYRKLAFGIFFLILRIL